MERENDYTTYEDYNQNYGNPYETPPPPKQPEEPEPVLLIAGAADPRRSNPLDITNDEHSGDIYRPRKQTGYDRVALMAYASDPRRVSVHPLGMTGCPPGVSSGDWLQLDADHLFPRSTTLVEATQESVTAAPADHALTAAGGGDGGTSVPPTESTEPEPPQDLGEMPFLDHLEEFRWALLKSIFMVVFAMVGSWFLTDIFYATITRLATEAELPLITTQLMEPVMIKLQMAFVMGLVISLPFVFYFLWSFISPGLYMNEKKWVLPLVLGATGCFLAGAAIAYFLIIPLLLGVIKQFIPADITPMFTIGDFISKLLKFTLLFGVLFEMPLVTFFLAKLGILKYKWMKQYRRYAIVMIFVASAIFTPPDPISQIMMAIPLVLLYEVSVIVARFAGRKTILSI